MVFVDFLLSSGEGFGLSEVNFNLSVSVLSQAHYRLQKVYMYFFIYSNGYKASIVSSV